MDTLVEITARSGSAGCSARPKPESGRAGQFLADFLESDLQESLRSTQQVIERINELRDTDGGFWSRNGNGYKLIISSKHVVLEDLFAKDETEAAVTIDLTQFTDAVHRWAEAIGKGQS